MYFSTPIRFKASILFLHLCLFLFCFSSTAAASKAYVTDQFRISLRRGPTIENKILRFLPSGSPVEVIQKTDEGWTEVKTLSPDEKQITGWILSRYIIHRLPYQNQTNILRDENIDLKQKINLIQEELDHKNALVEQLTKDINTTKNQLDISEKNFNDLKNNSKNFFKLKGEFEELNSKYTKALEENKSIELKRYHQWMAVGAAILVFGYLFGFLGGRREKKNKRRGYF